MHQILFMHHHMYRLSILVFECVFKQYYIIMSSSKQHICQMLDVDACLCCQLLTYMSYFLKRSSKKKSSCVFQKLTLRNSAGINENVNEERNTSSRHVFFLKTVCRRNHGRKLLWWFIWAMIKLRLLLFAGFLNGVASQWYCASVVPNLFPLVTA